MTFKLYYEYRYQLNRVYLYLFVPVTYFINVNDARKFVTIALTMATSFPWSFVTMTYNQSSAFGNQATMKIVPHYCFLSMFTLILIACLLNLIVFHKYVLVYKCFKFVISFWNTSTVFCS